MKVAELRCLLSLLLLMSGCARGPGGGVIPPTAVNRLIVRATFDAPVDDRLYYFVALDDDDTSADGPLPLRRPAPNGWGTGSFTTFVQYHLGQYQVFQHVVNPDDSVTDTPINQPFTFTLPAGDNQLIFTLDMDNYWADDVDFLDINFITTDEIITDSGLNIDKTYDGLGPTGNDYITIPVKANATFQNNDALSREFAGDVAIPAIDITDWRIEIERG
ncbi:MAG: hypothetical protein AUJ92_14735 [Armatimonadetes bacterium CG2_30_59_28]|nr:hypothetical protein [Armatimonadota bacterium]OIO92228.1 MAG: hypothetical protein AUJ92_14735 [Armatimonadetes bacterium CG2_30_59_28]PIU64577.1 MAG: hypothetical protein COS85_11970 [Armatimonadetes bacterium CG07_land_8_20_14_0_80_59_28]PIX39910.1 MAG: hypothetical protein COZ56_16210 [Armatimonadetes bacterium CG_4_8_14_3_um_filter_58_9]PIY43816.1 MAG: hypothetical protein COZ05_09910 [Armatimonadetes bacterium CG_4_10_14_3_um_filter_59_10]